MATFPQSADISRASTRVNRLDRASPSGVELAGDLEVAANQFIRTVEEKKTKDDAVKYALARNEMQQAAIDAQKKIDEMRRAAGEAGEDTDPDSLDGTYLEEYNKRRAEIFEKYRLGRNDQAILDSESRLIAARGRNAVAGQAETIRVDQGRASVLEGIARARESLISTPPAQRNQVVLGQLDAITEAEKKGWFSAEEAVKLREQTTQDFARATIDAMDDGEAIDVLERSLRYRKGYGSSLGEHTGAILEGAEESGLSPELIAAVIQQESSGNASARSDEDAVGLMQLKQAAASEMGVEDRLDPRQNVIGGAGYLAKMFERFQDPEKALAAYNWGQGNLQKAIDEYGDDWLAHAPQETKDYVAHLAPQWETGGDKEVNPKGKYDTGAQALSPDDIRNGEGTGSAADFLHADTAAKMLEARRTSDKVNQDRKAAFAVVDAGKGIYPEDDEAFRRYVRANTDGSIRAVAESEADQIIAERKVAKAARSMELHDQYSEAMESATPNNPFRYNMIPTEDLEEMSTAVKDALRNREIRILNDQQFAPVTNFRNLEDGRMSVEEWNDMPVDDKLAQNLNGSLWRDALAEKEYGIIEAEQRALKNAPPPDYGGLTTTQMVRATMAPYDDDDAEQAVLLELNNAITQESGLKGRKLTQGEKLLELNKIMLAVAYIDDWGTDDAYQVALLSPEQRAEAYVPIEGARKQRMPYKGQDLTVEEVLIQTARDAKYNGTISERDIETAYFYMLHPTSTDPDVRAAEILRRLKGDY